MTDLHDANSVRTEGDSWDITESVGATALSVAAARAVETATADPLIRDEFAYLLVSSAGKPWERLTSPGLEWIGNDEHGRRSHRLGCDYQAVRTHFFDSYFAEAVAGGIRQVVILAAGLDSRAYRLDWPAGTTVYEIDQPQVVEYKTATLNAAGAAPKATRKTVPVDLRDDWPAALSAAGFDRTQPTGWLAEGLLPYLPAEAQDRLFEMLTELSAPGSQVAVEAFSLGSGDPARRRAARRIRFERMRERLGLEINVETLTYQENDRADAAEWLTAHGWRVRAVSNADEMARLGRPIPTDLAEEAFTTRLLRAELGAAD
ncbi:class I SAM-dependent methyltransferase [Mycobacterium sp.]|jgi:methyltransferase (TIGR00027 family)|uniref:class I SAM-dependent methyltransferase n=1 Tax=Mycobacterium sp. TaxID=1785 RepID=UPI002CF3BE77|nr:class I SAM-dependent methyltransferase [Mycobacterium sp.]HXB89928.1 class I SAM-dependent methyltransferase [Mycobacterium sp.]